jgi:ABC-type branched-subunit amino acid transport system substrate-binding protein
MKYLTMQHINTFHPALRISSLLFSSAVCVVGLAVSASYAQSSIKIGMVLPLSGPLAATGNDIAAGTRAAIETVNRAGGIKGQPLELLIEDDRFDPKASEALSLDLVKTKGADVLLSCFGTVSCLAVAKVAQDTNTPLLAPIAGAEILRNTKYNKVYSLRANASEEVGTLLSYLAALKLNKTPVVIQDDGFGNAYAASLQSSAAKYQYAPSSSTLFNPTKPNYIEIATTLLAGQSAPPAVLIIANTVHSVGIIKALNEAKYYGQILNLAGQANSSFVKNIGNGNQLAVFATVTPSPFDLRSPAAVAYRAAWQATNKNELYSYISFEAFLNAQVLIQALRRSNNFTASGIDQAIGQPGTIKFYELNYSFANKRRQAASYTDLAMLSKGSFRH